jgi:hypothetical protein
MLHRKQQGAYCAEKAELTQGLSNKDVLSTFILQIHSKKTAKTVQTLCLLYNPRLIMHHTFNH